MLKLLLAAFLLAQAHGQHDAASDKDSKVPAHQKHPLDKNAPKPAGEVLDLKVGGETAKAYLAKPKGKPQGALLVLHEYWGLNDWVKHQSDLLAREGYTALAVDLYKGKVATDPKEAVTLMSGKDEKWGDEGRLDHARQGGGLRQGAHRGGREARVPLLRRGSRFRQSQLGQVPGRGCQGRLGEDEGVPGGEHQVAVGRGLRLGSCRMVP